MRNFGIDVILLVNLIIQSHFWIFRNNWNFYQRQFYFLLPFLELIRFQRQLKLYIFFFFFVHFSSLSNCLVKPKISNYRFNDYDRFLFFKLFIWGWTVQFEIADVLGFCMRHHWYSLLRDIIGLLFSQSKPNGRMDAVIFKFMKVPKLLINIFEMMEWRAKVIWISVFIYCTMKLYNYIVI